MPLRDHFRAPIEGRLPWESLYSGWAGRLAESLNAVMPPEYYALERMRTGGGLEIDLGTVEDRELEALGVTPDSGGTAVLAAPAVYAPPAAAGSCRFRGFDTTEIRVFTDRGERKVVAAIELVSPRNKDRDKAREAFVGKCLDYLGSGIALLIVDVVTSRRANLHNQLARMMEAPTEVELADDDHIYATSYRPTGRGARPGSSSGPTHFGWVSRCRRCHCGWSGTCSCRSTWRRRTPRRASAGD